MKKPKELVQELPVVEALPEPSTVAADLKVIHQGQTWHLDGGQWANGEADEYKAGLND